MLAPIPALAKAEKVLLATISWAEPDSDGVMQFLAPLAIEELTIAGLFLRGRAYQGEIDRAVTFQVELGRPGERTRVPLVRVDWRPLSDPHKNPFAKSLPDLSRRIICGTHVHPFGPNWIPANNAMRRVNLPLATTLDRDPQNFAELLDVAKILLRIANISRVPRPEGIERLL